MSGGMINLNVYYSAACNLNCDYCAAAESNSQENEAIRQAIINGSFQEKVIAKCEELQPVTLGIWGLEPSINQDLWNDFITPILTNCESIKGIFLSTNGILFDPAIWYAPLYQICNTQQRKIKLWVQWSIDGPNYYPEAKENLMSAIELYEYNPYFRVKFSTKSSLTADNIHNWSIDEWYDYMTDLRCECNEIANENCDILMVGNPPTLVRPGNYTKEDGIKWADWVPKLTIPEHLQCSAGNSSFTIDYEGTIYDCPLKRNHQDCAILDFDTFLKHAIDLYIAGEIKQNDWHDLYNIVLSQYCWANSSIDDLDSYIKIWGNGAVPFVLPEEE